jgi:hypothetical protein
VLVTSTVTAMVTPSGGATIAKLPRVPQETHGPRMEPSGTRDGVRIASIVQLPGVPGVQTALLDAKAVNVPTVPSLEIESRGAT